MVKYQGHSHLLQEQDKEALKSPLLFNIVLEVPVDVVHPENERIRDNNDWKRQNFKNHHFQMIMYAYLEKPVIN